MIEINKEKLYSILEESRSSDLSEKYLAWSKLDKEDQDELSPLGIMVVNNKKKEEYQSDENYWSPKYPIALEYYPYNGCEIYTDGNGYFFVYKEFGGHAPEKRCRFIRKELII